MEIRMNKISLFMITFLMVTISALAYAIKPTHKIALDHPRPQLERLIPTSFGSWRMVENNARLVSPEVRAAIDKIYAETLSRVYINQSGELVMLSLAYGEDQSDEVGAHLPEGCYAGQGFAISAINKSQMRVNRSQLAVKTLLAEKSDRIEPITYWLRTGDEIQYPGWPTKLTKLKYAFKGDIPDGLLFRVSSLLPSNDTSLVEKAFQTQQVFISDLISAMPEQSHFYLIGRKF
jgi:EpsI family protein